MMMSVDEVRNSLVRAPSYADSAAACQSDDDGVVELSLVDPAGSDWRLQRLGPRWMSRSSSSRDSLFAGDGTDYEELLRLDEYNFMRGLSPEAIARLPRRCVGSREKLEDPITKEIVKPGTSVFDLPCAHSFEKAPVLKWFERHRTCPVCRYEIEP